MPCAISSPVLKRCARIPGVCLRPLRRAHPGRLRCHRNAPVLAMNTTKPYHSGTVRRGLPGIVWRLEPVAGIETGRRLLVRGPNVMLGYLRETAPGVLEGVADGWYDTGDIVTVENTGFVTIVGRAKRFAKIGGEMVSMTAAEALAASLWPDAQHAVISVPDPRKGKSLLLVTSQQNADTADLIVHARARLVPEIWYRARFSRCQRSRCWDWQNRLSSGATPRRGGARRRPGRTCASLTA